MSTEPEQIALLEAIGLSKDSFDRYRGINAGKDWDQAGLYVEVCSRDSGMSEIACTNFIECEEDPGDPTYAYYYFRPLEGFEKIVEAMV